MAQSPSHKFGQIVGDLMESVLHARLQEIADRHNLYLDYKHKRKARAGRKKVSWTDHKENVHDLDYVLEEGGTEDETGTPRAFIECAWRRYTKHSRNKASEIQCAVVPLTETYRESQFMGVVLAGEFTEGSLQQLRSNGFGILFFPYETIVRAFRVVGIDASFEEDTPIAELQAKVDAYEALDADEAKKIVKKLNQLRRSEIKTFLDALEKALTRRVAAVAIVPLHGLTTEVRTITDAVEFIREYNEEKNVTVFVRFEVTVRYNNGDRITGDFSEKQAAVEFLTSLA